MNFYGDLKNDFFRRIIRLFESFYFYIKGNYLDNLYNNTIFKIIENKKIYYWACDFSENSGEGKLAKLFLEKLKKKIYCNRN